MTVDVPLERNDLTICVAASSRLFRTKVDQALGNHVRNLFDTDDLQEFFGFVDGFRPQVVILGFRFFSRAEFPGKLAHMRPDLKPKLLLTGTSIELETDTSSKGVDGLLCIPFLPEMLRVNINALLNPGRNWKKEKDFVLSKMRKYQRFTVEGVSIHFHKPVQERTEVLDISYQGVKASTEDISAEHVGEVFQMQITQEGAYLLISGTLLWVREGVVGVRFAFPRPPAFEGFIKKIIASTVENEPTDTR